MEKLGRDIKKGDVFILRGKEIVAVDGLCGGALCVTIPRYFIYPGDAFTYGYTNCSYETISENEYYIVSKNLLINCTE